MVRGVPSSRVAAVRAVVLAFVASMVVIVGAVDTKPAEAAFAGKKGRIAFMNNRDDVCDEKRARHRGVETSTAEVLGENRRVPGLLDAVFVEVNYLMKDAVYHVRVPLRTPEEMAPARTGQRAA